MDKNNEQNEKKFKTSDDLIAEIKAIEPGYEPPKNVIDLHSKPDISTLIPLTFADIQNNVPKNLEFIFYPCLPTQGIAWIYAPTGLGKTLLSLNLAYAIAAGGSFLKYPCPKPRRVLYVDGEMSYIQIYSRIMQIYERQGKLDFIENFRILTPDKIFPTRMPLLDEEYGQKTYLEIIKKYEIEVIFFDNLSMLSSFDENKAHEWKKIQDWLLLLRAMGKSVIMVHHAGKSGDYRGTSKMLDFADVAIALESVSNDRLENEQLLIGKQFKIKYKKSRVFGGKDALPFEVTFKNGFWDYKSLEQTEIDRVVELYTMKMSQRDIAKELSISLGKVNQLVKRAKDLHLIRD